MANHWVSRQLTQIGSVHVAKQVLASKVTYHATYFPMSEPHARELASCLSGFVGGSSATLRPGRAAFALPWEQGGMRLTQVQETVASLQAKIISRLLQPERLVWKDFAILHFGRSQQWPSSHPHISRRTADVLGYGVIILFSTRRIQDLGISSGRVRAYARAFRRLQPHRLVHPSSLTLAQIVVEPLFQDLGRGQTPHPHGGLPGCSPDFCHSRGGPTPDGPDFGARHPAEAVGSSAA